LPADFGNYLRQGRFKYIFLYGPRKIVKCKLLLRNHPKKSSKIGSGWKEFCTANGFHQTIDLVFEVDHMKSNQNVKVLTYCNFQFTVSINIFIFISTTYVVFNLEVFLFSAMHMYSSTFLSMKSL